MKMVSIEVPNNNCEGCKFLKSIKENIYTCVLFDTVLENYPNKCISCKSVSKKVLLEKNENIK